VPLVTGPVAIRLIYPQPNDAISTRDSNFIFGSVGNGNATLTINGTPVRVAPNGTFLGFLPVPPPTAPAYELVAATGTDTARLSVPVRVPPAPPDLSLTGPLVVDSGSVSPRGETMALRDDEPVRVSVRAPQNATAWVVTGAAGGRRQPLVNVSGNIFATDVRARELRGGAELFVARNGETVHFALARIAQADSGSAQWVQLGDPAAAADTDADVIGRDVPAGTYKWLFLPGTMVRETGRSGGDIRVRLDSQLEVWVDSVRELPAGYPAPNRVVGAMAFVPAAEWVDLVMPMSSPPPYLIEQELGRIHLTLYDTRATPEIIKFLQNDSLVRMINWEPIATDRLRIDLELTQPPYGYLMMWDPARGLVLRLRRAPRVDLSRPLAGRTITVDPGHPPGGAIDPVGMTEAEAALDVGVRLERILEERGAHVVMTRTDMNAVELHSRSVIARRANADALVSIHLNAFPEGVNPFVNNGTSTLFFHPQSEPLARLVQSGMMRELGLHDLGVHYQNIAIGRTSWMPSILCEGLFMMIPEQGAAIHTAEYQERYAVGVADGIEAYFRSLAQAEANRR
jgi:N-acetylmuramoyl-L-alanine amidase